MSASPDRNPRGQRRRLRLQPWLEGLEDRRVLSTFKVNTTLDTVAVDLKKGKDASGHISLRSAIEAANAKGGNNKIILPGGTFLLTIAGAGEDNAATGDLDIKEQADHPGQESVANDHRWQQPGPGLPGARRQGEHLASDDPARPIGRRGRAAQHRRPGVALVGRDREQRGDRRPRRQWCVGGRRRCRRRRMAVTAVPGDRSGGRDLERGRVSEHLQEHDRVEPGPRRPMAAMAASGGFGQGAGNVAGTNGQNGTGGNGGNGGTGGNCPWRRRVQRRRCPPRDLREHVRGQPGHRRPGRSGRFRSQWHRRPRRQRQRRCGW